MRQIDRAYAAGFFDGEGSVTIICRDRADRRVRACRSTTLFVQASISQNNPAPLIWIKERWGGCLAQVKGRYGRKPNWVLIFSNRAAVRFLSSIFPFLKVKEAQAKVALDFQWALLLRGRRPLTAADVQAAKGARQNIRLLNHRFASERKIAKLEAELQAESA